MTKRKGGLGVDAFFDAESDSAESQPKRSRGRPALPNRSPATFNLADGVQNSLDRAWFQLREMAPDALRKSINKSQIVEAALVEMLAELDERGRDSKLAYHILGGKND